MDLKKAAAGGTKTAAVLSRVAATIDSTHGCEAVKGPDAAAESIARHLSRMMAEDDLGAVVRFLSDALDLARTSMQEAGQTPAQAEEPFESSYWLG